MHLNYVYMVDVLETSCKISTLACPNMGAKVVCLCVCVYLCVMGRRGRLASTTSAALNKPSGNDGEFGGVKLSVTLGAGRYLNECPEPGEVMVSCSLPALESLYSPQPPVCDF